MKRILVIGAGKSTSYLIDYLLKQAEEENWQVTVGDMDVNVAAARIKGHAKGTAVAFNVNNDAERENYISSHDLVISMLPATMHGHVAKDCLRLKKHMTTASYVSAEMKSLDNDARASGLIFMNEVGLDPGVDHASAMKVIDEIHANGGEIEVFKSWCGGLVAPESNDNPWGYKFSWNPRNVILAGQGTAQFLEAGELKFIPYNRVFTATEQVHIDGAGMFDGYANRDSVSYRVPYGINNVKTILRGTLRYPGYCKAWNVFVKLGLTDDTWKLPEAGTISWPQLLSAFLPGNGNLKERLISFAGIAKDTDTIDRIEWLGLFNEESKININGHTPASALQTLLEKKWVLRADDKDMIVMQHFFSYVHKGSGQKKETISSLCVTGQDQTYTAMAKTVGLPLAIVSKMILKNKITHKGVLIPVLREIYEPLLAELEKFNIKFTEAHSSAR